MAQTMTIEQAQEFLARNTYGKLRAVIADPVYGQRNATICNGTSAVIVLRPRSKRYGFHLDWSWVKQVFAPAEGSVNLVEKFIKKAQKAQMTNGFIRRCLAADPSKGLYEQRLTTGSGVDGKIISVKSIGKEYPELVWLMREAIREKRDWNSGRWRFRGYDMSINVAVAKEDDDYQRKGEVRVFLNMEYRDCGNGYYYEMINEDEFIGVDVD